MTWLASFREGETEEQVPGLRFRSQQPGSVKSCLLCAPMCCLPWKGALLTTPPSSPRPDADTCLALPLQGIPELPSTWAARVSRKEGRMSVCWGDLVMSEMIHCLSEIQTELVSCILTGNRYPCILHQRVVLWLEPPIF